MCLHDTISSYKSVYYVVSTITVAYTCTAYTVLQTPPRTPAAKQGVVAYRGSKPGTSAYSSQPHTIEWPVVLPSLGGNSRRRRHRQQTLDVHGCALHHITCFRTLPCLRFVSVQPYHHSHPMSSPCLNLLTGRPSYRPYDHFLPSC